MDTCPYRLPNHPSHCNLSISLSVSFFACQNVQFLRFLHAFLIFLVAGRAKLPHLLLLVLRDVTRRTGPIVPRNDGESQVPSKF